MYAADLIDLMMPRNDFDVVTALNNLNDQLINKVKVSKLLQLKWNDIFLRHLSLFLLR